MSGGIEEPYNIAQLPKPLDAENGRIWTAPVHSISGSKKRKRHEVVLGVDGESINIYNIQTQSISTSYPLPPQSYLAAPPCSVYRKRAKPDPSLRHTYIATHGNLNEHKARLLSITETLGKPQSDEREPRAPAKRERKLRSGGLVGIDVLLAKNNELSSVLVCYRNGNVDCLSHDLGGIIWEHNAETQKDMEVEFAAVVDLTAAKKGLLKGRPDVLALLQPTVVGTGPVETTPLLFQVVRRQSQRHIRVFVVRNTSEGTLQSVHSPLEELLDHVLPSSVTKFSENSRYELHSGSGILCHLLDGRLRVFDLSGTLPKLTTNFSRKMPRVLSFCRLSTATVLTVSANGIAVHETRFGSVLSSLEYSSNSLNFASEQPDIVSQFTDLGIVVALFGTNLAAFQVGDILDDGRRSKAQGPLLIDVLGKGQRVHEPDPAECSEKELKKRRKWEDWTGKIRKLVDEQDAKGLDARVAIDLHLDKSVTTTDQDEYPVIWDLPPRVYDPQHVNDNKATYLLAALFAWRPAGDSLYEHATNNLLLKLLPKNSLRWLASAGYLTSARLQGALPKTRTGSDTSLRVQPGDIIAAIQDIDPSFETFCDIMSLNVHWDIKEVVRGLQILIQSFDIETPPFEKGLITDSGTNGITVKEDSEEAHIQAQVEAASKKLEEAQSMLDTGLENRSRACQILFLRLHSFPTTEVSRALHETLTQKELVFFIAILRLELADAGWTKKYLEEKEGEEDETQQETLLSSLGFAHELQPSNQAIRTIVELYSCAVDAVGLSGWLVGLTGDVEESVYAIQKMKSEIEAALECLFGVTTTEPLMEEVVRTAGAIQQSGHYLKRKSVFEEAPLSEDRMLPLASRYGPLRSKSWKTQDGKKSKIALAEEKSRSVGKYSFEQIRF